MLTVVPFLLDAITIFIIFLFCVISYKRGFSVSLVSFFEVIVSIVAAVVLSRIGAVFIYEVLLKGNILKMLTDSIANVADKEVLVEQLTKAISGMPKFVVNMLEYETGGFSYKLNDMIAQNSQSIAKAVLDMFIAPIVKTILRAVVFIIVFIICKIIFKILANVMKIVRKIPFIGALDGILGGAIGLVEGVFVMYLIVVATMFLIKATNNSLPVISYEAVLKTNIFIKFTSFQKILGF